MTKMKTDEQDDEDKIFDCDDRVSNAEGVFVSVFLSLRRNVKKGSYVFCFPLIHFFNNRFSIHRSKPYQKFLFYSS